MRMPFPKFLLAVTILLLLSATAFAGRKMQLSKGQKVYVPVYSHIYQGPKNRPYRLSALLSIRNVDAKNAITITYVRYYDDDGRLVRNFFEDPIVIPPLATREAFISERDSSGGSGANFTVNWTGSGKVSVPIIQAVMIGTASTQGISFVCTGVAIEEVE
ncbi:DUF3124 domain-containing protein [Pseudodesulfovibrio piezophilus]|uniref:DUF3124 domain-containing protein n=1 Tax=Pseudodesulfovibrio piezophilus (strain DSM 21447 / JCM 15486 / C1TLV30) TaxID=1322246 RepID=M1WM45_PSEP2|nr:DUF3124 domain-containing protein [Pseudodesulfovibrio piezophilus]CCH48965.1 conserved exported protein of unknown function [Pseudodesulfovibrio piezophilus C1TLV30]